MALEQAMVTLKNHARVEKTFFSQQLHVKNNTTIFSDKLLFSTETAKLK